jgi:hypothetical protein
MLRIGLQPKDKCEKVIVGGIAHYVVNFNIEFNYELNLFQWESVQVSELTYDKIVSAIIKGRYNDDKIQAIMNNYLFEQTDDHIKEFMELQEWRKFAKSYAKEILAQ